MTLGEMIVQAGRPTLAVTGAGGFIGQRVVAMARDAGLPVIALLRTAHEAAVLRETGADVRIGSLDDAQALCRRLKDADVLIHLAYDMRASGSTNMETFLSVMAAAGKAGIARIVHASSVVVYDDWPVGQIDETSAIGSAAPGSYRAAKIAMEQWLFQSPFEVAVLQPTIVYGPGSALWTARPISALRRGDVVLPEPVGMCPALYVDDLADAVLRAAVVGGLTTRRYLISGDEGLTWQAFWEGYAGLVGKGGVRLEPREHLAARIGPAAAPSTAGGPSTAAKISAAGRRILGRRRFEALRDAVAAWRKAPGVTFPDRFALELYSASPNVSIRRARDELGFVPQVGFANGLARIREKSL